MILTCDDCDTKFMVQAESFGARARKVRCGNCGYVWSQEPLDDEAVAVEAKVAADQKENLEAVVKAKAEGVKPALPIVIAVKAVPKWMKAAMVVLVGLNVFGFILLNKDLIGQTGFYNTVGNYDTRGITLENVKLVEVAGDKENLYLSGAVHNGNKGKMDAPERRVRLLDKDLHVVSKGVDKRAQVIEPGADYGFDKNRVLMKGARYMVLDIGNPYELMTR